MKKFLTGNYVIIIYILIAFFLTMGLISLLLSGTLSRFVNKKTYNHSMSTTPFYFVSTELTKDGRDNIINYYNNENILVHIQNGYGSVYTKENITYELSCTAEGYTCKIDNQLVYEGTLVSSNNITENTHEISLTNVSNESSTINVYVTAESKSPYQKTLTAHFILNKASNNESTSTVLLQSTDASCTYRIVNNTDSNKLLTVSINTSNFIFDDESDFVKNSSSHTTDGNNYYNSVSTNVGAYSPVTLTILKRGNTTCNINNIIVS